MISCELHKAVNRQDRYHRHFTDEQTEGREKLSGFAWGQALIVSSDKMVLTEEENLKW